MNIDSIAAITRSCWKYTSTANTVQNVQHWLHEAILPTTWDMASANPKCCMSVAAIMTAMAVNKIIGLSSRDGQRERCVRDKGS